MEALRRAWTIYRGRKTKRGIVLDISFLVVILLGLITPIRRGISTYVLRVLIEEPPAYEKVVYVDSEDNIRLKTRAGEDTTIVLPPGRVTLLNRGNIWSAQTRAELKGIEKLRREIGDKIEIVFISADESGDVEKYFKRRDYHLRTLYAESEETEDDSEREGEKKYAAAIDELMKSIPGTLVIDKSGRIRVKKMGAARWDGERIKKELRDMAEE